MTSSIDSLDTPVAVVDVSRMQRNIQRMQNQANRQGVRLRPHVKTTKCEQVVAAQVKAGAQGITVSTLKEAQAFFAQGITDILYAVAMAPTKLNQALALRRAGCSLTIVTDSVAGARAITDFCRTHGERFEVFIEIDSDHHRSGVRSDDPVLIEIARILHEGGAVLKGVMTHAGESYKLNTLEALQEIAEIERSECGMAAEAIRSAGLPCQEVSVGSTPTALSAVHLDGVTELRAGVYVFFDLVMHNVGVCQLDELALSVLTTVIGHQPEKGWIITDSGWMAMSRDRGTQSQQCDFGYGLVCDTEGKLIDGLQLRSANQEHGVASFEEGQQVEIEQQFPIGTRLRILPNHACATGAQYQAYEALDENGEISLWPRLNGW
ncbi:DSD1 family PLP-dependent enzyme [Pseudomonas mucidolens]|uniref:D-serine deaminase, pyridoxal phosphate-dependent n=1 Tax=Pseudomonas mucidolens TaxID=46679 RepID=A0A1H2M4R3_9PSED|nr:DSD1 family PLP-dependent enzyme [Pseudomonas mucidolens]SDU88149.1 D-serine deaminase, pyridoxal phosphate-dependent [Pseudomonas mucidolens]SQH34549.1 putative metal-activated pyridoxal enzyme [Pseudomonas mucidolens]